MSKATPSIYHKLFHRNMLALMTFNPPSKALKACFKKGMFSCPNQEGFVQVSHFLMNIIYPGTKAFKSCWPILDKSQERAFRAALIDLIRGFNDVFDDIYQVSYVVPARLMSPGGDRFMKIMWEISLLALGVHAKRESKENECFFPQMPPTATPQKLRRKAVLIWQANARENMRKCEANVAEQEERLKIYEELKRQTFDRMLARDKRVREIQGNALQLFKESNLGEALILKLLNLINEDGILALEDNVKPKEQSMLDMLCLWKNISILTKETKEILEAAIAHENDCHKLILNITSISEHELTSGAAENTGIAKANGYDVSLLEYIINLHDRFKALKPVMEESHLSKCISKWESILKEKESVESVLRKLESRLESELLGLSSHIKGDSIEGDIGNESQAATSIVISTAATTSTPIKNTNSISSETDWCDTVNITPYQPATSQDFFYVQLEEALKVISDEKETRNQSKVTSSKSNDSSIDELLERFRKIVEIREQRSDKILE